MNSARPLRALVTGATGFIGSWLCYALLGRGVAVNGLALERTPGEMLAWDVLEEFELARVPLYSCDIRDRSALAEVIWKVRPDIVFHLAAQALVLRAWEDPTEVWGTNVAGTWNLFSALDGQNVDAAVIFASSDKAYGRSDALPYREDQPLLGEHPYDASKAAAERVARSYVVRTGRRTAIVRCGNVGGGGDMHMSRIVPGTSLAVLSGVRPIIRSDGSPHARLRLGARRRRGIHLACPVHHGSQRSREGRSIQYL